MSVPPSSSGVSSGPLRCVKVEGVASRVTGYANPLYGEVPELFEDDGSRAFTRSDFAAKYKLIWTGLNPKQVRVPRDCTHEEVMKLFGPRDTKNGHQYVDCKDEKLIARIENLWMILHQRKLVPASRTISQAMARGFACEVLRNKKMNWAVYGEWTNVEQFRRRMRASGGTVTTVLNIEI